MAWEFRRKVRYYETDRMGVVHHSNYLRFLEDARMEWMDENVMPYSEMERRGIIVPAVSAEGKFLSFLRFGDEMVIAVKLIRYTGVQLQFSYEVRDLRTGTICYTGETGHYFAADGDYHPISLKRKFPDIHQRLLQWIEP